LIVPHAREVILPRRFGLSGEMGQKLLIARIKDRWGQQREEFGANFTTARIGPSIGGMGH